MAFALTALDCFSFDTTGCYSLTHVNYIPSHTSHFPERERGRTRRPICMAFALIALDCFSSDTTGCYSLTHVNYILSHTSHFPALGKKRRDEDIYEWCSMWLTTHMNASTRNALVAPLTLWTPLSASTLPTWSSCAFESGEYIRVVLRALTHAHALAILG